MKNVLKGKYFAHVKEVKEKNDRALKIIKNDEFANYLEQWKKCLNRGIASNGEHFEGG